MFKLSIIFTVMDIYALCKFPLAVTYCLLKLILSMKMWFDFAADYTTKSIQ